MKIIMIRHGMTAGNKEKKYIGITDEPLCEEGIRQLIEMENNIEETPEVLFVSPMLRCRQTAEILFPGVEQVVIPELAEMDFGIFENRAFKGDLEFDPEYQKWLDTMCEAPIPKGESKEVFQERCVKGFQKAIECTDKMTAAFVVHGGTIMSIMSHYGKPEKAYYEWGVSNGRGYIGNWSEKNSEKIIEEICSI